jgi:hypothetical protein
MKASRNSIRSHAARGLLFAGHSENFHYVAGGLLRTLGHTVYAPAGRTR